MENSSIDQIYKERVAKFNDLLQKQSRSISMISIFRLLSVAGVVYFIALYVKTAMVLPIVIAILLIILFFALVSYHNNQSNKKKLLQELLKMNEQELSALDGEFHANDDGRSFSDSAHAWSNDLDLFGEGSIYQYLNRTATHQGPFKLSELLTTAVTSPAEIRKRQAILKELSGKLNLRQHFAAHARLMIKSENEYEEMLKWVGNPVFIENYKWTKIAAYLVSALSCTVIIAGIINPVLFRLLIPIIIINFLLLSPFVQRTNRYQSVITKRHRFLETYSRLQSMISKERFEHAELKKRANDSMEGMHAVKHFSSLLNLFDQRLNFLTGLVFNALFLFDFHMLHRLASWKRKYRNSLPGWLEIIGEMDAQFSLAGFHYNHPGYSFPELDPELSGIVATKVGHPMIRPEKRIDNSIDITNEKVILITGANMAGKSTFLRSLGINLVLAYAGCPVCAKTFTTGTYSLFSSMRTNDSLKDDESYFFAEIKRLKGIVDRMESGEKLMILLDEVLKGTNTTDKQKGSRGLIMKSISHDVLCFIATHDLALGEMEKEHPGEIVNYCFESYIEGLDLVFDYTIRTGIAKNMNASFLMRKMGIMD